MGLKIGVVIVTYNRRDKLIKALSYYEKQNFLPKFVLIVNNCSTDGTNEYLNGWKTVDDGFDKYVITTECNGGSFYLGFEKSLNLEYDFLWVSDDDAYPTKNSFEILSSSYENLKTKNVGALCNFNVNQYIR